MTYQPNPPAPDIANLPSLPGWVTRGMANTPEAVAFRSGAALSVLDALVGDPSQGVPWALLANRLALRAAVGTAKLEGRVVRESDLRDAFHLAPPGDARGPDGDLLAFWRDAVRGRAAGAIGADDLRAAVGRTVEFDRLLESGAARAASQGPLAGCAHVLRAVLEADDRAERAGCLLSDAVLARHLGWKRVLPLTAPRMTRSALRALVAGQGVDAQAAVLAALVDAVRLARDLARRAAALQAVAPKLRSKGSAAALALFLAEDAVAPSMLSPMIRGTGVKMSPRAARRFCDRLVALGVAQELTGRATFRLYGIAP